MPVPQVGQRMPDGSVFSMKKKWVERAEIYYVTNEEGSSRDALITKFRNLPAHELRAVHEKAQSAFKRFGPLMRPRREEEMGADAIQGRAKLDARTQRRQGAPAVGSTAVGSSSQPSTASIATPTVLKRKQSESLQSGGKRVKPGAPQATPHPKAQITDSSKDAETFKNYIKATTSGDKDDLDSEGGTEDTSGDNDDDDNENENIDDLSDDDTGDDDDDDESDERSSYDSDDSQDSSHNDVNINGIDCKYINEYDTDELGEEPSENEESDSEIDRNSTLQDEVCFKDALRDTRAIMRKLKEKEDDYLARMKAGETLRMGDMTGKWTLYSYDYLHLYREVLKGDEDYEDYSGGSDLSIYCMGDDRNIAEFTLSLWGGGEYTFETSAIWPVSRRIHVFQAFPEDTDERFGMKMTIDVEIAFLGRGLMWIQINEKDVSRKGMEGYCLEFYASHDGRNQDQIFAEAAEDIAQTWRYMR